MTVPVETGSRVVIEAISDAHRSGLHPDHPEPWSEEVPGRFQLGTAGLANIVGITAAVNHWRGWSLELEAGGSASIVLSPC